MYCQIQEFCFKISFKTSRNVHDIIEMVHLSACKIETLWSLRLRMVNVVQRRTLLRGKRTECLLHHNTLNTMDLACFTVRFSLCNMTLSKRTETIKNCYVIRNPCLSYGYVSSITVQWYQPLQVMNAVANISYCCLGVMKWMTNQSSCYDISYALELTFKWYSHSSDDKSSRRDYTTLSYFSADL